MRQAITVVSLHVKQFSSGRHCHQGRSTQAQKDTRQQQDQNPSVNQLCDLLLSYHISEEYQYKEFPWHHKYQYQDKEGKHTEYQYQDKTYRYNIKKFKKNSKEQEISSCSC